MLKKFSGLRTNENILLAIDALLHSKSTFLTTFLMTYMVRISIDDSPIDYIVFRILTYVFTSALVIFLLNFIRRHSLLAWRLGILLSVVQVIVIMTMSHLPEFPFILALVTGLESVLFWRPNIFFSITEVRNDRRLRFQSLKQIIAEVIKVIAPLTLALVITDSGYLQSATIILVISVIQLFLSVLFRPTHTVPTYRHHIRAIFRKIDNHASLRRVFLLQFFRGFLVSGSAFLIIPSILIYDYTGSDLNLGAFASLAAGIAIVMILVLRRLERRPRATRALLLSFVPIALTLPLILIFSPTALPAIFLYIFAIAIFDSVINMFMTTRIHNSLKKHLAGNSYTLEIESISEIFLCSGRVLSLTILLMAISLSGTTYLPLLAFIFSFALLPGVLLATRKKKAHEVSPIPPL